MARKIILLSVFIIFCIKVFATYLDVRVYSGKNIYSVDLVPLSGEYTLYGNGNNTIGACKNDKINIALANGKLNVTSRGEDLGSYDTLYFKGKGLLNTFRINPVKPFVSERIYNDNVKLWVVDSTIWIINHVDLEHYVAGVVQTEVGGSSKNIEFFKVQAVISRTYALNNLRKHAQEGFNLCDSVHCQVYKGRCNIVEIMMAATQTIGEVIIDSNSNMITAAFHSNCGGQTVNSEYVWSTPLAYLKSVKDTFCLHKKNARWEYKMPKTEWLAYMSEKCNYPATDSVKAENVLEFLQNDRKVFFADSINLKFIRADLKLRSTWFSIKNSGDTVCFSGRGYGHGIGLCQEGAIHMAETGKGYKDIIKFYYTGVDIVNINETRQYRHED